RCGDRIRAARFTVRRFELVEGTSSKFWEIEVNGRAVRVRWGRIGSDGQTKEKTFADPHAAEASAAKQIEEKLKKGYLEAGAKGSAKKAAPAKAKSKKRKEHTTAAAVPAGPPGTFAFTAAQDADYALGWPHMHRLTDDKLTPKQAVKIAMKPFRSIDPVWDVEVPRAAAHAFLHALNTAPPRLWLNETDAAREKAAAEGGLFPESAIEGLLAQYGSTLRDTYRFPFESAVYLLE